MSPNAVTRRPDDATLDRLFGTLTLIEPASFRPMNVAKVLNCDFMGDDVPVLTWKAACSRVPRSSKCGSGKLVFGKWDANKIELDSQDVSSWSWVGRSLDKPKN